jgi:hypothetical protein
MDFILFLFSQLFDFRCCMQSFVCVARFLSATETIHTIGGFPTLILSLSFPNKCRSLSVPQLYLCMGSITKLYRNLSIK